MSAAPYTFARYLDEADEHHPTIYALARAIVARRDKHCAGAELATLTGTVCRDPLPGGVVVVVRARDGSENGRGALIGYAFVPGEAPWSRLMTAICDVQAMAAGQVAA